ncbi:MAG: ACT domain-containing protein [Vitreoscilla sp.]|nr:ACT domain-containing protein [Vitreoscilla sp.]
MSRPVTDLALLLSRMEPVLNEGVWVYAMVPHGTDLGGVEPLATFREAEGLTLVVPEADAQRLGWPELFRAAWITLQVHSDLQAVGLTAAFARALGDAGISCNVLAGACHDHLFVPVERSQDALAALRALSSRPTAETLPAAGAVVFAKDLARVAAYYQHVVPMTVQHAGADHVVLQAGGIELTIHAIPELIARDIAIAEPPALRDETPIKLFLPVDSLAEVRRRAPTWGGGLGPATREWAARGFRACDGHDPEGNVVQFREASPGD